MSPAREADSVTIALAPRAPTRCRSTSVSPSVASSESAMRKRPRSDCATKEASQCPRMSLTSRPSSSVAATLASATTARSSVTKRASGARSKRPRLRLRCSSSRAALSSSSATSSPSRRRRWLSSASGDGGAKTGSSCSSPDERPAMDSGSLRRSLNAFTRAARFIGFAVGRASRLFASIAHLLSTSRSPSCPRCGVKSLPRSISDPITPS